MSVLTTDDGRKWLLVGGTMRNDGTGWKFLNNEGHIVDDLSVGQVTSTYIEVLFPPVLKVNHMHVTLDDSFAKFKAATHVGPSVGLYRALVYGTENGVAFNPLTSVSETRNLWVSGRHLLAEAPA